MNVLNTVYQNTSLVQIFVSVQTHSDIVAILQAYSDTSNPPTTLVAQSAAVATYTCNVSFVVAIGAYYKVVSDDASAVVDIWIESALGTVSSSAAGQIRNQTYSYVDLATVKHAGNLDLSTMTTPTLYDDMLLFWAENCSKFIDEYLHTHFYCWEGVKYFNGGGSMIDLGLDLLSISDFKLDLDGSGNFATSVAATDYVLNPTWTYPKRWIKRSLLSTVGVFASNVPSGIKITGVWGYGTGDSATPYLDSLITGTVATTTGRTLTLSAEGTIQAGHVIRVESEQMYVIAVSGDGSKTATVLRGVNGTTAATHSAAVISVYQFHTNVVAATLVQLSIWWKRRESAYAAKIGNAITGEFEVYKGLDPAVKQMLDTGKLKRHVL